MESRSSAFKRAEVRMRARAIALHADDGEAFKELKEIEIR